MRKRVQCERCEGWVCLHCSCLSEAEYSILTQSASVHWFCPPCDKPAITAVKSDNLIETRCEEYFSSLKKKLDLEVTAIKNDHKKLLDKFEELSAKLEGSSTPNPTKDKEQVTSDSIKELSDRDSRKMNLIWFGVPECQAEEAETRKTEDTLYVKNLCSNALKAEVTIKTCRRLKSGAGKDVRRPLLVTLANTEQVSEVLRSAHRLRDTVDYKGINVKKDMTPLERTQMRQLLILRNQKREEAKKAGKIENWVIRGDKVVNVQRQRPSDGEKEGAGNAQ